MVLISKRSARVLLIALLGCVSACASKPPTNPDNLCTIFKEKKRWYRAALNSAERWGGPIEVPMAIIYQESTFKHDAKPRMRYFLGFIPIGRASNAFGYAQALESTWAAYQKETGSRGKSRKNFADSVDFVQWYMHKTYQLNGVAKSDAYRQYLNYHEGQGGYSRGSYRNKKWLLDTAKVVERRAKRYTQQLSQCQGLSVGRGWFS